MRVCTTLAMALLAIGLSALAAPVPTGTTETLKDRTGFIPQRQYQPLPGKVVGVLVSDVAAVMGQEGRSGPPDAMGFSRGGGSYNWVYVPVEKDPLIRDLHVRTGEKGDAVKIYPRLSMANARTVEQWQIDVPYALVEVEVNDNLGAPADQAFVATRMRRLDGTRDFPVRLSDVVSDSRERWKTLREKQQKEVADAFDQVQRTKLADRKLTGPRETKELFYVTWLPDRDRLQIRFRTTVTDGAYQYSQGGVDPVDPRLPAKPGPRPPPRPVNVRYGTEVTIEYGVIYEFTPHGKLDRTYLLPVAATTRELPPPPGVGRPGDRLPVDR
jgi:hypothetical protein